MEHSAIASSEVTLRILLLEDSDIDAELIETHLSAGGFKFELSRSETREAFETGLEGQPDIVLADFALPSFDGMTALAMTIERAPAIPFIFVSGVIGEEFATAALQQGATDYVTKRNLRRLPVAVSRAVQQANERRHRLGVEAALKETEQRFRLMADHAPALIWACDEQGRLTFANRRFETDFGLSPQVLLDGGTKPIFHPDDYDRYLEGFRACLDERSTFSAEMRAVGPKGDVRWLKCEATPRFDALGRFVGYVGCNVDVTDAHLAATELEARIAERTAELQRAEEALRQSQKMEAIGQLTGGIAHDFNNILAGIIGSLSVVKRRIAAGRLQDLDRFIDGAIASGNRAAALTQRLLAFSRRQSLDVKPTDVNATIGGVEDLLRRTLGENVRLKVDPGAGLWPAMTDPNQFDSAILNLVINARDAMPEGGTVTIATANVDIDAQDGSGIESVPAGRYVRVTVADTGQGMTDDVKSKAFDPFFTTKPIGQGTGLGLSMIYGFVKQTGGHVTIASELDHGTTIALYLQRASGAVAEKAAAAAPTERAQQGETVLVVEDDPSVRMLIMEALDELGYRGLEAMDSATALPFIEELPRLDLLVTDVGLPGMNGRQLAEIARQKRPALPVLFVTGYAEQAALRGNFLAPGMDLMAKPFEMDALGNKIRQMIGSKT